MDRRDLIMAPLAIGVGRKVAFSQVPTWSQFKPRPGSLKEKLLKGEPVRIVRAPIEPTRERLEEIIGDRGKVDAFNVDGQHGPLPEERKLQKLCELAEDLGAGVILRLPHPSWASMTGKFADLGVLSITVPLVEDVETADAAINNFYYPPLGSRSWGGGSRFGFKPNIKRVEYARWWSGTGILGFQIETLRAALNVRNIVKPGVTRVSWGPADMAFDIERHPNSPFETPDEVYSFVARELEGFNVSFPAP